MLDSDGQGIVLTNATFIANIDKDGTIRNHTKEIPKGITSNVYKNKVSTIAIFTPFAVKPYFSLT